MKLSWIAVLALGLATPAFAQEHEKCSITPVDQVGFVDTFTTVEECIAACKATEGCDSWSYRPHSFDKDKPGQCKLIKGIFKKEDSAKTFCGKI
ncbi:PAN domain-containing protein [Rhodobacteraceae bacterium D3-12]|nr:PAN domain-containing protein [Rhodobacteraceae bacterium D3-12]